MNFRTTVVMETLESRTLYSATPSATILADQAAITAAKAQLATDKSAATQTLLADKLKLTQDRSNRSAELAPLQLQLQNDTTAQAEAILTDHENDLTTRIADRTLITNDLMQIQTDLGNATAEAADHNQLHLDQQTLKTDISTDAISLANTKSAFRTSLLNDRLAIADARSGDDPTVDADEAKILSDKQTETTTVLADQEGILSAKLKLAQDEAAGV